MNIEYIDVMIEIFSRLPLKSLLRVRCVCKWWNQIISDPVFISNYSSCNPQYKVSGFYLEKYLFLKMYSGLRFITCAGQVDAAPKPSLSFIDGENGVCIKHSCNGLLLCSSFRCHEEDRKYYICKPTTKQYMPLPGPQCKTVFGISIAFNLKTHPITNSNTGCWRLSGNPFEVLVDFLFNRGVFWKGALHWVGRGVSSLRFDVERELLHTMLMPPIPEGWGWAERRFEYFGESGGHLYLIENYGPQKAVFDVMEMNGYYSGWFVKYHVNLDGPLPAPFPFNPRHHQEFHRRVFSVLHIFHRRVGEREESILVLHIPGDLTLYNLGDNPLGSLSDLYPMRMVENPILPYAWKSRNLGLCYTWESIHPFSNTQCYL
ncbi:hypothetical protein I3842_01G207600 [Carya illinoinensis]|uniref:F-box domain-containing protein n=1 Tax=Carya illinoinensis TaxID=32201 RepID=A0A922G5Z7_CARIL|nr:hypothetical protein I3842_01G207600 [Carya illinoinensis]